jgi:hypothetical protein
LPTPVIEELFGACGRVVIPELLKGFLKKVSTYGLQVVTEQIAQPDVKRLGAFLANDFYVGSDISEQTNTIFEASSSPMTVKNPRKDSMVLSRPTQSRRVGVCIAPEVVPRVDLGMKAAGSAARAQPPCMSPIRVIY